MFQQRWLGLKWNDLGKYFSHGIAFTLLFFISSAAWSLLLTALAGFGLVAGLAIGSALLFLIIGFLNSVITTYLWFDVKNGFSSLLAHGAVMFLALVAVDGVLISVPALAFPGFATTIVTFFVGALANGLVAKRIASYWKQNDTAHTSDMSEVEMSPSPYSRESWEEIGSLKIGIRQVLLLG